MRDFLRRYERSRNTFEPDLIETQHPDAFMFADPNGARITEKQAVLVAPSEDELFRTLGHASTTLESVDEATLDEYSVFILSIKHDVATIVFQEEHEGFLLIPCGRPPLS